MGAWSSIKIDNKTEIGIVKYGVPYFIKFIPQNKMKIDYNKFVATTTKLDYILAMSNLLRVSKHPFANYFLFKGIEKLRKIPGKIITIDYSDVNLDADKKLSVYDLITGDPDIDINGLYRLNSYNMWLDLMTLTGLISKIDLVGAYKYTVDMNKSGDFLYISEGGIFSRRYLYKIPVSGNRVSMNWYNYLTGVDALTNEFKIFISTFVKYHRITFKDKKYSMNLKSLKPYNFSNDKFAFFDIGVTTNKK